MHGHVLEVVNNVGTRSHAVGVILSDSFSIHELTNLGVLKKIPRQQIKSHRQVATGNSGQLG